MNGNGKTAAIRATTPVFYFAGLLAPQQLLEIVPCAVAVVEVNHVKDAEILVQISLFIAKIFQRFTIGEPENPLHVGFEYCFRQHLGQFAVLGLAFAQFSFGLFALTDIMQDTLGG
jgi:hypothetical protein